MQSLGVFPIGTEAIPSEPSKSATVTPDFTLFDSEVFDPDVVAGASPVGGPIEIYLDGLTPAVTTTAAAPHEVLVATGTPYAPVTTATATTVPEVFFVIGSVYPADTIIDLALAVDPALGESAVPSPVPLALVAPLPDLVASSSSIDATVTATAVSSPAPLGVVLEVAAAGGDIHVLIPSVDVLAALEVSSPDVRQFVLLDAELLAVSASTGAATMSLSAAPQPDAAVSLWEEGPSSLSALSVASPAVLEAEGDVLLPFPLDIQVVDPAIFSASGTAIAPSLSSGGHADPGSIIVQSFLGAAVGTRETASPSALSIISEVGSPSFTFTTQPMPPVAIFGGATPTPLIVVPVLPLGERYTGERVVVTGTAGAIDFVSVSGKVVVTMGASTGSGRTSASMTPVRHGDVALAAQGSGSDLVEGVGASAVTDGSSVRVAGNSLRVTLARRSDR